MFTKKESMHETVKTKEANFDFPTFFPALAYVRHREEECTTR